MSNHDNAALDARARDILIANDRGGYTIPTEGLYPYQWNWDSAFCGWGFSTFDVERAWQEFDTLFSGQWPNGMVPHILFRQNDPDYFPGPDVWGTEGIGPIPSGGISQPPVAATFVRSVWEQNKDFGAERVAALLPKIKAWHAWFMKWRTSSEGAVFLTHPWEAGRDNSPDWDSSMAMINPEGVGEYSRRDTSHVDPAMRPTKDEYDRYLWLVYRGRERRWNEEELSRDRPFMVADPTLTFILLRANKDLSFMMNAMGMDTSEVDAWSERLMKGAQSLRNPDTGLFNAINLRSGEHTGHVTSATFLVWYAGMEDQASLEAIRQELANNTYPIPSLAKTSPLFDGMRYWRGPTWAIMNALIGIGLQDMGHQDEAETLRIRTRALIAEHGFAEYFHPETGSPAGGGTFSWTAAVWLAWASSSVGDK
ncbi:MAG: MGH1-like glycoside hydrolase domain-containing protein [Cognatishimia activa]